MYGKITAKFQFLGSTDVKNTVTMFYTVYIDTLSSNNYVNYCWCVDQMFAYFHIDSTFTISSKA